MAASAANTSDDTDPIDDSNGGFDDVKMDVGDGKGDKKSQPKTLTRKSHKSPGMSLSLSASLPLGVSISVFSLSVSCVCVGSKAQAVMLRSLLLEADLLSSLQLLACVNLSVKHQNNKYLLATMRQLCDVSVCVSWLCLCVFVS